MFVPLLAVPLTVLLVAATDGVPKFDVKPSCQGAVQVLAQGKERLQSCLDSEEHTRSQLEKSWSTFPPADRTGCIGAMHFSPTYTELATCLEMKRDLRESQPPAAAPPPPSPKPRLKRGT
jgi:hypothetical protein